VLPSQLASGLSVLAPAQRAGAQRLCAMARNGHGDAVSARLLSEAKRKTSTRDEYFAF
jgi:hypothetical protein